MAAAHLSGPPVLRTATRFVMGCTGRPAHTQEEAERIVSRRGSGRAFHCRSCRFWHPSEATPVPRQWRVT